MAKRRMRILAPAVLSCWIILDRFFFLYIASCLPALNGFSSEQSLVQRKKQILGHSPSSGRRIFLVARVEDLSSQVGPSGENNNKLFSYMLNIQRERKSQEVKATRSLTKYLENNVSPSSFNETFVGILERTLIQGLRLAGEVGNYRLILQLTNAAIFYADGKPILKPRIFGEAIDALSKTKANVSKMKQIWRLASSVEALEGKASFLESPLSAYELNVMIKCLGSRGNKAKACIEIYKQHADMECAKHDGAIYIQPDAYTASALFSVLAESIFLNQQRRDIEIFESLSGASTLVNRLREFTVSPCWQWNVAISMLHTLPSTEWNNHVYSSLLTLQDKAQELIQGHQNGPQIVLTIFDSLMKNDIQPDIVTCTLAIKGMGDPKNDPSSWKQAVRLLEALKVDPRLPNPNEYAYAATIAACAKCLEFPAALRLLEEMREGREDRNGFIPPKPNTWVYNCALAALVHGSQTLVPKQGQYENGDSGYTMAMKLLKQMEYDHLEQHFETKADTVTYNTILSMKRTSIESSNQLSVLALIEKMKAEGLARDRITYRNAIFGCTQASSILELLHLAQDDVESNIGKRDNQKTFSQREMAELYNSALSTETMQNNLKAFKDVLHLMCVKGTSADSVTLSQILKAIGKNGRADSIMRLLTVFHGDCDDAYKNDAATAEIGNHPPSLANIQLDVSHYITAIEALLLSNNLDGARKVLSLMRDHGYHPTAECLQIFALTYAKAAIRSTAKRSKQENVQTFQTATSRANSAFLIAKALKNLSPFVLAKIVKACSRTAQWSNSRQALRWIHQSLLSSGEALKRSEVDFIRSVHSGIIRECNRQQNITAALTCANDIQNFARLSRGISEEQNDLLENKVPESKLVSSLRELQNAGHSSYVGMRSEDWVTLIKCASDAGHWKVCVNSLQFLKPHLKRTNSHFVKNGDAELLEGRYEQLLPALTATCICLEKRSQYAWGERILNEWMQWSGRRPRPEAALAIIRNLSARGRGEEVKSVLSSCIDPFSRNSVKYTKKGVGYEEMLYIGAITALHNNGMYDDADEVFISAISREALPFVFGPNEDNTTFVLDLHGMNVAIAHSAVRVAMRRLSNEGGSTPTEDRTSRDMMIITGRGRNSALRLRPVLRPEVQRMLLEEFYPPLNTVSSPGNTGALVVFNNDIAAWQTHQEEQKGVRMLTLAALLKNASTDRIKVIADQIGH